MPADTNPITGRYPHPEGPKLRSSCDGCGTAKVKCDRERPSCGRCTTLNSPCTYGLSRRLGKPRRKRLSSVMTANPEKCTRISSSAANNRDNATSAGGRDFQNVSISTQINLPDPAANTFPISLGNSAISDTLDNNQQSMDFYPSLLPDEWPYLDSFGPGLEFALTSPFQISGALSNPFESNESHSCPRESYEIFRDLICPSPSLHAPESNSITVSAQLDQVLQFNRDAISRLTQVLSCDCAKSGHRAMVHASIVSRILIWYQQAAGWTGSSSWGPRPPASSDTSISCDLTSSSTPRSPSGIVPGTSGIVPGTSPTCSPALVQATGFAVEHVPVSVGTFSIDDQNVQAAIRNQLILSELKKTSSLIKLFMSQDSGESTDSGFTGLYSHLGKWLQSEHSRTMRILQSRLKTFTENLGS